MKNNYSDNDKIYFVKIDQENLELACQIQNKIFPEEDAKKVQKELKSQKIYYI